MSVETYFKIGDRVEVCDPVHEIPYVAGVVDGITLGGDYEVTPDGGSYGELLVPEVDLIEEADSEQKGDGDGE